MDMSSVESVVEAIRSGTSVGIRGHGSRDIPSSDTRPESWVEAPSGVVDFQPDEMIVRVRAGTTIAELDSALAIDGQFVHGADSGRGTIGGVLACGRSGLHRLGRGSIRDVVLEVRFIDHQGNLVKAGGPTVKNVSGFDLGRLFVGSFGSLASHTSSCSEPGRDHRPRGGTSLRCPTPTRSPRSSGVSIVRRRFCGTAANSISVSPATRPTSTSKSPGVASAGSPSTLRCFPRAGGNRRSHPPRSRRSSPANPNEPSRKWAPGRFTIPVRQQHDPGDPNDVGSSLVC